MTYRYRQSLLGIRSEVPFPDIPEKSGDIDVDIVLRPDLRPPPPFTGNRAVEIDRDVAYHCWDQIGCFLVQHGTRILVKPDGGVDPRLLGHFVARIAFASILQQRGITTLHGSAVATEGDAVVIIGPTSVGKSALAAALHLAGCQVLADDVVAIDDGDVTPYVRCASQHLQLWPPVAAALEYTEPLQRVVDAEDKIVVPTEAAWPLTALPLRLVVCLAAGDSVAASTLTASGAMRELARSSFIDHIAGARVDKTAAAAYRRIAGSIPCIRLTRRNVPADIWSLTELVLSHMRQLRSPLASEAR